MIVATFTTCKKSNSNHETDNSIQTSSVVDKELSEENVRFLDSTVVEIQYSDIFTSNGKLKFGIGNVKNSLKTNSINQENQLYASSSDAGIIRDQLVTTILSNVENLTLTKNTQHHKAGIYVNEPPHDGIAYSRGQIDFSERHFPTDGNELHLKYAVFGTDCSGLLYNLFTQVGIPVHHVGSGDFENELRVALSKSYNDIKVLNMGHLKSGDLHNGDLVYWKSAPHIGIIGKTDKGLVFYSSHGKGFPENQADQELNWSHKRGIVAHSFDEAVNGKGFWGNEYEIIRMVVIGDELYGGNLAYIDKSEKHGLIAASEDQLISLNPQVTEVPYNSVDEATKGGTNIYDGAKNTQDLVKMSLGSPLKESVSACVNYPSDRYKDWYLPSISELNELYKQKDFLSGLATGYYATSTWSAVSTYAPIATHEYVSIILVDFSNGLPWPWIYNSNTPSERSFNVRAVRKF